MAGVSKVNPNPAVVGNSDLLGPSLVFITVGYVGSTGPVTPDNTPTGGQAAVVASIQQYATIGYVGSAHCAVGYTGSVTNQSFALEAPGGAVNAAVTDGTLQTAIRALNLQGTTDLSACTVTAKTFKL